MYLRNTNGKKKSSAQLITVKMDLEEKLLIC